MVRWVRLPQQYHRTKIQEIRTVETHHKVINTNKNNIISKITKFCKTHNIALTKRKEYLTNSPKRANFTDYQQFTSQRKLKYKNPNTLKFQNVVTSNLDPRIYSEN